ncbi:hypothetical protein ABBQ38_014092 [Trebouxia sp. C0009 RCD-2024]
MLVVTTASTRSSASGLQGTASGHSLVKNVHVPPLTEMQMQAVIFDLAKRIEDVPVDPSSPPPQLLHRLQLTNYRHILDCWCNNLCLDLWLGDFNLIHIVDGVCSAMSKVKWQGWLASNDLKVTVMNQPFANCVYRVPIIWLQLVPVSDTAGATVTWQDVENDGVAYIGEPGQGLWSGDSGHSSSSRASQAAAASEPGSGGMLKASGCTLS